MGQRAKRSLKTWILASLSCLQTYCYLRNMGAFVPLSQIQSLIRTIGNISFQSIIEKVCQKLACTLNKPWIIHLSDKWGHPSTLWWLDLLRGHPQTAFLSSSETQVLLREKQNGAAEVIQFYFLKEWAPFGWPPQPVLGHFNVIMSFITPAVKTEDLYLPSCLNNKCIAFKSFMWAGNQMFFREHSYS